MTDDPTRDHAHSDVAQCDHAEHDVWFDRSFCPDPCGAMHERCEGCNSVIGLCRHEPDVSVTADQASRMLNVSVAYVNSLLLSGEIELTVGSVLAYRERDDTERRQAAEGLTRLGQELEQETESAP